MKYYYIGSFPPPYGGVTIKNDILYKNLNKYIEVKKINLASIKRKNLLELIKLFTAVLGRDNSFIIGASSFWRKKLTQLMYYFNKNSLRNSILIIMGGTWQKQIARDAKYKNIVAEYKSIYVETKSMMQELNKAGLNNIRLFPNCRELPDEINIVEETDKERIKCIYFSLISEEKGAKLVFDAIRILKIKNIKCQVDFYGVIDDQFKPYFEKQLREVSECAKYKGVFKADISNVYKKLSEYDVLLFPTKCATEGVPGVLVESKIAGITAIVSDMSYNSEIIKDGVDGIVNKENTTDELVNSIEKLQFNRELLKNLKYKAKESSKDYIIDNYISEIVRTIKNNKDECKL